MSNFQKFIKFAAIVFAIMLIVGLFSSVFGVLGAVGLIDDLSDGIHTYTDTFLSADISSLKIETDTANIKFASGDEFKITVDPDYITLKQNGGELEITEKAGNMFYKGSAGDIILTYPADKMLDRIEVEIEAGDFEIDNLTAESLELKLGAGNADFNGLKINESDIDGGTGSVSVKESVLKNFEIDVAVGELDFSAKVLGRCDLDLGVGESTIELIGAESDYQIYLSKGLGSATFNGNEMSGGHYIGKGNPNEINISGGVGEITVTVSE